MKNLIISIIAAATLTLSYSCTDLNASTLNHQTDETEMVYVTPYGECYHRKDCRTIKSSYKAVTKIKAISMGRRACKVCKPEL